MSWLSLYGYEIIMKERRVSMLYKTFYESSLGNILIVSDENNIIGLWFEGQKYFLANIKEDITQKDDLPILQSAKLWLDQYFAGQKPNIADLKLAPRGNDFRLTVWKILLLQVTKLDILIHSAFHQWRIREVHAPDPFL